MTHRIASLCRLGFRAPFSSRFVWALLPALALIVLLLPAGLKNDGTKAGEIRMILTWTFGPAFAVLAAATMWTGCAALSSDIEEGRHTGTAVSPARPLEIWLGRWLGLVLTNAVVLLLVTAGIYAQLRLRGLSAADIAVVRRLDISQESVMRETRAIYAQAVKAGAVREGVEEAAVLESIRGVFLNDMMSVEPGRQRDWDFVLRKGDERKTVSIAFAAISSLGSTFGCKGEINVFGAGANAPAEPAHTHTITEDDGGRAGFEIPAGSLPPGNFRVTYMNVGDRTNGVSALVRHNESMTASVPGGGALSNIVLCAAILLSLLSALAGIGVTLGAMFSFPVAAFAGAAVVLTAFAVGGGMEEEAADFEHSHDKEESSRAVTALTRFSVGTSRAIAYAYKPFIEANVFDRLGDKILLDSRLVAASAIRTGLLLPLIFGFMAALTLRRREL